VNELCVRVVDALLREDVRECVTRGVMSGAAELPQSLASEFAADQRWLCVRHFGAGQLWIPVTAEIFMQPWRLTQLPLLWQDAAGWRRLRVVADVLACFRNGLDEDGIQGFAVFERECAVALEHGAATAAERERWFDAWRASLGTAMGTTLATWQERQMHYDRLASFLDHPFYPTARAKVGFGVDDLASYGPEFRPELELRWLAVPRAWYCQRGDHLPPVWPEFHDVGLPRSLASSHALVPVHPFTWREFLDRALAEHGLADQTIRAPRAYSSGTPTLSVRTLALCDAPDWHVKLPLAIRTLGAKNIRLIKPSTIADGHAVQRLLGEIVAREPSLYGRVLLTDESTGAHVANHNFLGFIVRRYPAHALAEATPVPVAALGARTPRGDTVIEELAGRYFGGDSQALFDAYLDITLALHLRLWVRYGVALESNQQNSVVVLSDSAPRLRLLLKDNDAARIQQSHLAARWPELAALVAGLQDARIGVSDELPLAQMFTTITLQLNIATLVQTLARLEGAPPERFYKRVRLGIERVLQQLSAEGEATQFARQVLLEDSQLYVKYLLIAATLADKRITGASDVNKYYGRSAPNVLADLP